MRFSSSTMLGITAVAEIRQVLLEAPEVVDRLEDRDTSFVTVTKGWLDRLEEVLRRHDQTAAAEVASLRGILIAAERGVVPQGINVLGSLTRLRVRDATATQVITRAQQLAASVVEAPASMIEDAERVARQLLALAAERGLLGEPPNGELAADRVRAIWDALRIHGELGPLATRLLVVVGPADSLLLLQRLLADRRWWLTP